MRAFILHSSVSVAAVMLLCLTGSVYAQQYRELGTPADNQSEHREPVVDFLNGNLPFREGDKWGFADKDNKLVIEPQFDSIFYAGEGYCLAHSSEGTKLINEDLEVVSDFKSMKLPAGFRPPTLDGSQWDIRYLLCCDGFILTDKAGKTYYAKLFVNCEPGIHVYHSYSDFGRSFDCAPPAKPSAALRADLTGYTLRVRSALIDSVTMSSSSQNPGWATCYYKDGHTKHLSGIPGTPRLEEPVFLRWTAGCYKYYCSPDSGAVLNLETMDTLLYEHADYAYSFTQESVDYHIFLNEFAEDGGYFILNGSGDTVIRSTNWFVQRMDGLVIERSYGETPCYTVLRLKDGSIFETGAIDFFDDYQDESPEFIILRGENGLISYYSAETEKLIVSKRWKGKWELSQIVDIICGMNALKRDLLFVYDKDYTDIYSSSGKLLLRAKLEEELSASLDKTGETFEVWSAGDVNGIYLPAEDSIRLFDKGTWGVPFGADKMVFSFYDPLNDTAEAVAVFTDFAGNRLNDLSFGLVDVEDDHLAASSWENTSRSHSYFDFDLKRLRPSAMGFLRESGDYYFERESLEKGEQVFFSEKADPQLFGVMSRDFKVLIPAGYKTIKPAGYGHYYVVTMPDGRQNYLRMDGTRMWR